MKGRELNKLASEVAELLPGWKTTKTVVYRRAGVVLQGIHLEGSDFLEEFVPVRFLQVLSEPFPTFSLTLGDRFRDDRGADLWLEATKAGVFDRVIEEIRRQVVPSPEEPLSELVALEHLLGRPMDHSSWHVGVGVLLVLAGKHDAGRDHFAQAAAILGESEQEWARNDQRRLREWMSQPGDFLAKELCALADDTAKALCLS